MHVQVWMCVCGCMYEVFTAETHTIPCSLSIVDLFLLFSTTGVCCVYGRWFPLCPPQNTKRASWYFSSPGDFISVWSGGLGFGKIAGRRGGYRTQLLLGHGLACLLPRCNTPMPLNYSITRATTLRKLEDPRRRRKTTVKVSREKKASSGG